MELIDIIHIFLPVLIIVSSIFAVYLKAAHTEFWDRLGKLKSPRGSKTQLIKEVIQRRLTNQFFKGKNKSQEQT